MAPEEHINAIVDLGFGNLSAIRNILRAVGSDGVITSDPHQISKASRLVLPGVGAFDMAVEELERRQIRRILDQRVLVDKVPILGICLGMQLMADCSDEGHLPGLGWVSGRVVSLGDLGMKHGLPVPSIGWGRARVTRDCVILAGQREDARFYFVHSYAFVPNDPGVVTATAEFGEPITAAIQHGSIYGVQFHPEKSLDWGKSIMRTFARLPIG